MYKTKSYLTILSDSINYLTTNLSINHNELIKATISDLQYGILNNQLKKYLVMHLNMFY